MKSQQHPISHPISSVKRKKCENPLDFHTLVCRFVACRALFLLLAFAFLVPGFAALSLRVRGALVGLVGFGVGLGLGRVDLVAGVVHDLELEGAAG